MGNADRREIADVTTQGAATPAFGQADLSNCEREQIHLAGSIQPHGALLVVREPDLVVIQISENASAFLGYSSELLGQPLSEIWPELVERIAPRLGDALDVLPAAVRCSLPLTGAAYNCQVHRPPAGGLVIEFERASPTVDRVADLQKGLQVVVEAASIPALCNETARIFRALTGYDRVMVYQFDNDGHGKVFSEERDPKLEPLLGNRYPATDIPQMARRLYERNRVRVLVDVHYTAVPLLPRLSPLTGKDLDMSLCFTRSMSPIHIQYLKNMGVCATLVVSLLVGGRLWGLIACHHYQPRFIPFELRTICELLAETIGTRIAALESFAQSQAELAVRRLEQRMIEAISRDGDWRGALFDNSQWVLQPVGAMGAALLLEDKVLSTGEVPGTEQLRELGAWLDTKGLKQAGGPRLFATSSLSLDEPRFAALRGVASGLLATPVSNQPGDYLLWFRPEQVRTVTWGGNPFEKERIGNSPFDLSPRRSFAQWHQVVECTSEPWTPAALATAGLIGETLTDVVIQFRSVRMLIAQHQLELVQRQVQGSEQAVVVTDLEGKPLLISQAFESMLPPGHPPIAQLADLAALFEHSAEVAERLRDLLQNRKTWRGEAEIRGRGPGGGSQPVLVRADPVFSAPGRVLGFVLVFSDLSERRAADRSRQRFQEQIVDRSRLSLSRMQGGTSLQYQNLLSAIVENAQLAALEITDSVEVDRMPELLDSLKSSVDRSADLLQHLLRHAESVMKN